MAVAGAALGVAVAAIAPAAARPADMAATSARVSARASMPAPPPLHPNLGPGESVTVSSLPPLRPSTFPQARNVGFHEFQADCSVARVAPNDPIVFPRMTGASHSHTFIGARTTDAASTTRALSAGATSCTVPADHSAYWFPTLYDGARQVLPQGPQIIYYKSGINAYNTVRAFPRGLRFLLGNPKATAAEFARDSLVSGWSCGDSYNNWDFPASCPGGAHLLVRYKAPSCWDGKHLDSPDHRSHMAYPVDGACPRSHRVAVPMLEFKIAYPVIGHLGRLHLSSGRGYSWHADFFAAWSMPTQEALVTQCINGGGQCDDRGYDQHRPERGRVLDNGYRLVRPG